MNGDYDLNATNHNMLERRVAELEKIVASLIKNVQAIDRRTVKLVTLGG